jgi:hypothetical protein
MRYLVVATSFFIAMTFSLVSNGANEISLDEATNLAYAFFNREVKTEGALGRPTSDVSNWLFPVKLGYAGTVQPIPIVVDRHTGFVSWPGLAAFKQKFIYIGDIPAVCPITINTVYEKPPLGFHITPKEAVKIASEHSLIKCNSIFLQVVYSDSKSYYIVKSVYDPTSEDSHAIIVNGQSGTVTLQSGK